jgi:hypothetical protein
MHLLMMKVKEKKKEKKKVEKKLLLNKCFSLFLI